jgi:hypothetical protein
MFDNLMQASAAQTYSFSELLLSSLDQVFPSVVMATPVMLTKTATTFAKFRES